MSIKRLTKQLNELLDMIENESCYLLTVYRFYEDKEIPVDSLKFNSFEEAFEYQKEHEGFDKRMELRKLNSLSEELDNESKIQLKLYRTDTGYFLENGEPHEIYPIDGSKDSIDIAVNEFLEDEYLYNSDREVLSLATKWLSFDPAECVGEVEVTLIF